MFEAGDSTAAIFLAFLRVSAFMVASPFPGQLTPAPVRVILAAGLALVIPLPDGPAAEVVWVRAALVEVAVGLVMGFAVSVCLQAFALAGEIGGAQMGLANAGLGNPLAIDVNLMGSGYTVVVLAVFVMGDGPGRMLVLVERSFAFVPVGAGGWPIAQTAAAVAGDPSEVVSIMRLFFAAALRAAAPLVAAAFAAQVVLAALARAIPNLNWLIEGPSLTLAAGMIGLFASLETFGPLLDPYLVTCFEVVIGSLGR